MTTEYTTEPFKFTTTVVNDCACGEKVMICSRTRYRNRPLMKDGVGWSIRFGICKKCTQLWIRECTYYPESTQKTS